MKTKSWLRLYHEFADDPKIQMLAFEDQRHYVMVLCLKGRGVLDSNTPTAEYRERMIAKALGLDPLTAKEVKFRLTEPGLIDEHWQPVKWAERQFESDSSTDRVQKHRDQKRKRFGNVSSQQEPEPCGQLVDRSGNVSVTAQIRAEQSKNPPPGDSYEAKSADAERASPTGSLGAAPEPEKSKKVPRGTKPIKLEPYDEPQRRVFWYSAAVNSAVHECVFLGLLQRGQGVKDLKSEVRVMLSGSWTELVNQAIDWELCSPPVPQNNIHDELLKRIRSMLSRFKPPTPAELAALAAGEPPPAPEARSA